MYIYYSRTHPKSQLIYWPEIMKWLLYASFLNLFQFIYEIVYNPVIQFDPDMGPQRVVLALGFLTWADTADLDFMILSI